MNNIIIYHFCLFTFGTVPIFCFHLLHFDSQLYEKGIGSVNQCLICLIYALINDVTM